MKLREPTSDFQELLRRLALQAMSVTHHDAADTEEGFVHEVEAMERAFRKTLRSFLARKATVKTWAKIRHRDCVRAD
jgi:hypothetical protein